MNDLYENNYIHQEIIDEMDPYELENLMTELTYLNQQIKDQKKVVIDPGGKFQRIYNILTGKRRKLQNKIELDVTEAAETVSSILLILSKDIRLIKTNQAEIENKLLNLTSVVALFLGYVDQNLIQLPPVIKNELLLLIDPSVERPNSGYLTTSKETRADHMLGSGEGSNTSHEIKKESDNLVEDPKLKRKLRALRKDGYTDEDIEKEFGKLYIGLRTTDSYTTRRLKFHPPKYEPKGLIGNNARRKKEKNLFDARKEKIEKILNCKYRENYIIDKEWIYFIDEISHCLCRIRLDASEPEEKVYKDVNVLGSIYIKYGMICFTDSKYNEVKIRVPN